MDERVSWLTAEQVAEAYPISARALRDWRDKGTGPPFMRFSHRCVRYRRDLLEKWVADQVVRDLQATRG
jgi:DNA-binding transcriptional MerR regulator